MWNAFPYNIGGSAEYNWVQWGLMGPVNDHQSHWDEWRGYQNLMKIYGPIFNEFQVLLGYLMQKNTSYKSPGELEILNNKECLILFVGKISE